MIPQITVELSTEQNVGIPCDFIIDTKRYSKQLDGLYHVFVIGSPILRDASLYSISPNDAKIRYDSTKFKTPIMFCTNNVNCK